MLNVEAEPLSRETLDADFALLDALYLLPCPAVTYLLCPKCDLLERVMTRLMETEAESGAERETLAA